MTRTISRTCSTALALAISFAAGAHASSLVASMGIFAYPAKGQTAEQQSKDDYECFDWAKGQTGYDPMNPSQPVAATAPQQQPSGERLKGALRGAAGGAIIGEVTGNDAGDGAAVGATLGTLRGGRDARQQQAEAAQQAEQSVQQQSSAQTNQFKSAYGACMGGRGYTLN